MNIMKDIKRICALCGTDRTPHTPGGIYQVNDRRGVGLGLFGECCCYAVNQAVNESPKCYRYAGWTTSEQAYKWIIARAKEILGTS